MKKPNKRRAWSSRIVVDYTNVMSDVVGDANGIRNGELEELAAAKIAGYHDELVGERGNGKLRFLDLPYQNESVEQVLNLAGECADEIDDLVVFGIGGSALGTIALKTALCQPFHNLLSKEERRGAPRVFVLDNIDPDEVTALFDQLGLKKTLFNIVTKSGNTAETLSQFMMAVRKLRDKLGAGYKDHIVATTGANSGVLRKLVRDYELRSLVVPEGVGGRFSVLSPVGLFPAAMLGVDIPALLGGAAEMDEQCRTGNLMENPAYFCAAVNYILDTRRGKHVTVMIPYSAALRDVADWFRQLWAESLGKATKLDGSRTECGQTPVKALGATDQHSQIQLYCEGPNDKLITFLTVSQFQNEPTIPDTFEAVPEIRYLAGKSINDLLRYEQFGTEVALSEAKRPTMRIEVPEVSPSTLGALFYLFELETAMAGKLYGINPFDQPAVERGKEVARTMMGMPGTEQEREHLENLTQRKGRRIE